MTHKEHTTEDEELKKEWDEACSTKLFGLPLLQVDNQLKGHIVFREEAYPESICELDEDKVAIWWLSKIARIRAQATQEGYNRGRVKHCQQTHLHLIEQARAEERGRIVKEVKKLQTKYKNMPHEIVCEKILKSLNQ